MESVTRAANGRGRARDADGGVADEHVLGDGHVGCLERNATGPTPGRGTGRGRAWMQRLVLIGVLTLLATFLMAVRPQQLGGRVSYAVTHGESMEPALRQGDLVLLRRTESYRVGDAVAYHNPDVGRVVFHRIVGKEDGRYVLKGDNNSHNDLYRARDDDVIGRWWIRVEGLGRVLDWFHTPLNAAAASVILATLMGLGFQGMRWSRSRAPCRSPRGLGVAEGGLAL